MRSWTLVISLFFWSFATGGQSVAEPATNPFQLVGSGSTQTTSFQNEIANWASEKSCHQFPNSVRAQMQACQLEVAAANCAELAINDDDSIDQDIKAHLRNCSGEEIMRLNDVTDSHNAAVNCVEGASGAWNDFKDFLISAKDAALRAREATYLHLTETFPKNVAARNKALRECNIECKRNLTRGHPNFAEEVMPDEVLDKYTGAYLEDQGVHFQMELDKAAQARAIAIFDPAKIAAEKEKIKAQMNSYEVSAATSDLLRKAQKRTEKEIKRSQCYKRGSYYELTCYGIFTIVDPTLAAGLTVKGGRLALLAARSAMVDARMVAKMAADFAAKKSDRRIAGAVAESKTASSERSLSREVLIDMQLNKKFTTVKQNEDWILEARKSKYYDGTVFIDSENSMMQSLNKATGDKNLVTALTNKHKEIIFNKMKSLEAKYSGQLEFLPYSDFKSSRWAIKPKPPLRKVPAAFENDMATVIGDANKEYVDFLNSNGLMRNAESATNWFRAGLGQTADEANHVARYSRNASGANRLRSYREADYHENMTTALGFGDVYRKEISDALKDTPLIAKSPSGFNLPIREVFDVIKKRKDVDSIRETLVARFGGLTEASQKTLRNKLTDSTIFRMKEYYSIVDDFSPGIYVAERRIASLQDAVYGGLSADFAGMGARNSLATADALARAQGNLHLAREFARENEGVVTSEFQKEVNEFEKAVNKHMPNSTASGDDFVAPALHQPIPSEVKQKLVNDVSKLENPAGQRLSFIPENVPANSRGPLGSDGEGIEVFLRQNLYGKIPEEKLNKLVFAVDMKTNQLSSGPVDLIIGDSSVGLNDIERARIKKEFKQAVKDFNGKITDDNRQTRYRAAVGF